MMAGPDVVVIGSGPEGLSCAAELLGREVSATVLERGKGIGAAWASRRPGPWWRAPGPAFGAHTPAHPAALRRRAPFRSAGSAAAAPADSVGGPAARGTGTPGRRRSPRRRTHHPDRGADRPARAPRGRRGDRRLGGDRCRTRRHRRGRAGRGAAGPRRCRAGRWPSGRRRRRHRGNRLHHRAARSGGAPRCSGPTRPAVGRRRR